MKRAARVKDETPEEFFSRVRLPADWKLLGNSSCEGSLGKVYQVKAGVVARLWFDTICKRGGIGQRTDDWPHKPKYECIVSNKQAIALNEWIQENLINKEDEETID